MGGAFDVATGSPGGRCDRALAARRAGADDVTLDVQLADESVPAAVSARV